MNTRSNDTLYYLSIYNLHVYDSLVIGIKRKKLMSRARQIARRLPKAITVTVSRRRFPIPNKRPL